MDSKQITGFQFKELLTKYLKLRCTDCNFSLFFSCYDGLHEINDETLIPSNSTIIVGKLPVSKEFSFHEQLKVNKKRQEHHISRTAIQFNRDLIIDLGTSNRRDREDEENKEDDY